MAGFTSHPACEWGQAGGALTREPWAVALRAKVGETGGVCPGPKRVGWWQWGPSSRMRLSCQSSTMHINIRQ